MLSKFLPSHLALLCLWLCLCLAPLHCIKIGISPSHNESTTTTTTTDLPTTITSLDISSTVSTLPDLANTSSPSFPPRKNKQTTLAPKSSTTKPPAAPTAKTELVNATSAPTIGPVFKNDHFYYCACDLHAGQCEINCCCDRDCPSETFLVFNCLQSGEVPQLQARLDTFQYTHGLPTCQLHDGWLCVFRSNTKPAKQRPPSTDFDAKQYNKWPQSLGAYETQLPPPQSKSYYTFGQPLQLWHPESKQLSNLELPIPFESVHCQLKQTLRHLQPLSSSCLMNDVVHLQSSLWTLLNQTSSQQLMSTPRDLEEPDVQAINIKICTQLLLQQQVVCLEQGNDTQLDIVVDQIELHLTHNYTHILEAKLLLRETSVQDENEQLWLNYKLRYTSVSDILARPSSGPLGYVQGEPLLLAVLQPQNNSEKEQAQQLLNYFQTNLSAHAQPHHHWLTLCQHGVELQHAVSFGVDLSRRCRLHEVAPALSQIVNYTEYCQHLQLNIWHALLPHNCTNLDDLQQVFVSQLGRPQPDKWLPLQLSYTEDQRLPAIEGVFDETLLSLSCRNMLLSVSYEFYVSELTLLDGHVPHQSVLQHARVVLGQRHDLEIVAGEQHVELPVAASVMFFKTQEKRLNGSNISLIGNSFLIIMMVIIFPMIS